MPAFRIPTTIDIMATREVVLPQTPKEVEAEAVARALKRNKLDLSQYGETVDGLEFSGEANAGREDDAWEVRVCANISLKFDHEVRAADPEEALVAADDEAWELPSDQMTESVAHGIFDALERYGWEYVERSYSLNRAGPAVRFESDDSRFSDNNEEEEEDDVAPPARSMRI